MAIDEISEGIIGISHLVLGPQGDMHTAIGHVIGEFGSLGWTRISRLRALLGNMAVDEWINAKTLITHTHEPQPPTPCLNLASSHTVPWEPTWDIGTIKMLRGNDYCLHID